MDIDAAGAAPSVASTPDKWLQKRLDELADGGFKLLKHQPIAVRCVAGVPQDWCGEGDPAVAPTKGYILADDMGAGKTVSVLCGLLLRESLVDGPSLIIGPNWAVIEQWREHAARCGINEAEILIHKGSGRRERLAKALQPGRRDKLRLVLTDRYAVMQDLKQAVDIGVRPNTWKAPAMAPRTSARCAERLFELYKASKGELNANERQQLLNRLAALDPDLYPEGHLPENPCHAPAEQLGAVEALRAEARAFAANGVHPTWSTVVIDEAHFLKNPTSWWGMHGLLVGLHAGRFIAVTGTPFNTRACDMGQICAMVDCQQKPAESNWWCEVFDLVTMEEGGAREQKAREALMKYESTPWGDDQITSNAMTPGELKTLPWEELEKRKAAFKELVDLGKLLRQRDEGARLLHEWRGTPGDPHGLLRREKKDLNLNLPPKSVWVVEVEPSEAELKEYHKVFSDSIPLVSTTYDGELRPRVFGETDDPNAPLYKKSARENFLFCWEEWGKAKGRVPMDVKIVRYWFMRMMCKVQALRVLQTHPAVYSACGGRELTAAFAPSRKLRDYRPKSCHLCQRVTLLEPPALVDEEDADGPELRVDPTDGGLYSKEEFYEEYGRLDEWDQAMPIVGEDGDEDEENAAVRDGRIALLRQQLEAQKHKPGDLVLYPRSKCGATPGPHWVHRKCLEEAKKQEGGVPPCERCTDLKKFALVGAASQTEDEDLVICKEVEDAHGNSRGGFRLSSKLVEVRYLLRHFPDGERTLIFSSFKGFLDLLEATLTADGKKVERFDGDDAPDDRIANLKRFKTDASIDVMLSTPHCGGVGLNISEASRVIFTDRHLNPVVQQQAMDRAYRIGQTKPVHVYFIDGVSPIHQPYGTFDEFVRDHGASREKMAKVVLADGTTLGEKPVSFSDALSATLAANGGTLKPMNWRVDTAVLERRLARGRWAAAFVHPPPKPRPTERPGTSAPVGWTAPPPPAAPVKEEKEEKAAASSSDEPMPAAASSAPAAPVVDLTGDDEEAAPAAQPSVVIDVDDDEEEALEISSGDEMDSFVVDDKEDVPPQQSAANKRVREGAAGGDEKERMRQARLARFDRA